MSKTTYLSLTPSSICTYTLTDKVRCKESNTNKGQRLTSTNNQNGVLSKRGRKRLVRSIDWLIYTVKKREQKYFKHGTRSKYKLAFITLTLPSQQIHSDTVIKSKCLDPYIYELKRKYGVKNYVWRAELNANGNIHFHILIDRFIPWKDIRRIWNNKVNQLGYVSRYQDRFKNMSFKDYASFQRAVGNNDQEKISRQYSKGKKYNWSNPNSTDIHGIKKVKSIKAYISTYMGKSEKKDINVNNLSTELKEGPEVNKEGKRIINGRLWQCSQFLSKCKTVTLEMDSTLHKLFNELRFSKLFKVLNFDYVTMINVDFINIKHRLLLVLKNWIDFQIDSLNSSDTIRNLQAFQHKYNAISNYWGFSNPKPVRL